MFCECHYLEYSPSPQTCKNQLVGQRSALHLRLGLSIIHLSILFRHRSSSFSLSPLLNIRLANPMRIWDVPFLPERNTSTSSIVNSVGTTNVTNKLTISPRVSYAEVTTVSPPSGTIQSSQSTSAKNINKNNKYFSRPNRSLVTILDKSRKLHKQV